MSILFYIAKLILACGLLYGYYWLFLRNKQFHRYNRFYLLIAATLSVIIPFIKIPVSFFSNSKDNTTLIKTLRVIAVNEWEEPVTVYARHNSWSHWFTLQNSLVLLYISGAAIGLFILFRSLFYILGLKKKYEAETFHNIEFYNTEERGTPFSFFKIIFWNKQIPFDTKEGQQIFRHELFHVKQQHSSDILLMEILCCFGWFNPFFHLIKKEIKAIHEFLADEYAVSASDRYEYAELLVLHAIQQKTNSLPNHFFHNQIKRRIAMITQSNLVRRSGYFSRIMALPLVFVLFSSFAVKLIDKTAGSSFNNFLASKNAALTVVIDAGHGGIYPGSSGNGLVEKDITLTIAQKIKQLSEEYHVNVVLTRNADETVGNAPDLAGDLENRVAIGKDVKADLFISIHINATSEKATYHSGFEANISKKRDDIKSKELAAALIAGFKDIYTVNEAIQQRPMGIQVLDKSICPAVLIECGYITNPKDVAFIIDKDNQEKIAKNILESIVKYQHSNTADHAYSNIAPPDNIHTGNKPGESIKEKQSGTQSAPKAAYYLLYKNKNLEMIPQDTNTIFTKVEIEADYPGGKDAWKNYLNKQLKYPMAAIEKEIKGTVVVQFIVDKEGNLSDIKAISGPKELQEESIRVLKESGKWQPAVQNGKKVKAYKRQPIIYKLSVS